MWVQTAGKTSRGPLSVSRMSFLWAMTALAAGAAEEDYEFFQCLADGVQSEAIKKNSSRAVVLINGLQVHPFREDRVNDPESSPWQASGAPLVRALLDAGDSDVFSFSYVQRRAVDEIAADSSAGSLATRIQALKEAGYSEIVLVGHSAGGLVARQFVENFPDSPVTTVIQVGSPNEGSGLAELERVYRTSQAAFVESLKKSWRSTANARRGDLKIPPRISFIALVGVGKGGGDAVVSIESQWSAELRAQGVPALPFVAHHRWEMQEPAIIEAVVGLVPRKWDRLGEREISEAANLVAETNRLAELPIAGLNLRAEGHSKEALAAFLKSARPSGATSAGGLEVPLDPRPTGVRPELQSGVGVDLIFVIDTTGSMSDDIDEAKEAAGAILAEVFAVSRSSRVAIVAYRDEGDEYVTLPYPWTTDPGQARSYVRSLSVGGGGDHPEAVYEALLSAIACYGLGSNWRSGVKKVIILMGDAPPHTRRHTADEVVLAAERVDPAHIFPIAIAGADPAALAAFEDLAKRTGGKTYRTETAADLPATLVAAIRESYGMATSGGTADGGVGPQEERLATVLLIQVAFVLAAALSAAGLVLGLRRRKRAGQATGAGKCEWLIGRGPDAFFRIDHDAVSARHAVIVRAQDGFRIRDLGSSNGMYVNGTRVSEAALRPQDRLRVGEVELSVRELLAKCL